MRQETLHEIISVCEENGIDTENIELLKDSIDSLQYISVLVALEDKYQIMFPDYVLEKNIFEDIEELADIIEELTKNH